MVTLQHRSTFPSAQDSGIRDLHLVQNSGENRLYYSANQPGTVSLRVPEAGWLERDLEPFDAAGGPAGAVTAGALLSLELNGQPALLGYGAGLALWRVDAQGGLSRMALQSEGALPAALTALTAVPANGAHYIVGASRDREGLEVWQLRAEGQLRAVTQSMAGTGLPEGDIHALELVRIGGRDLVLALSQAQDMLVCYSLSEQGRLQWESSLSPVDGLFLNGPTQLETVRLSGQDYVLVGAPGSGSLAVVAVAPEGGLQVVDQVNDGLGTRFGGLTALQAVTQAGQSYVVATGADDGLSLFALLPGRICCAGGGRRYSDGWRRGGYAAGRRRGGYLRAGAGRTA